MSPSSRAGYVLLVLVALALVLPPVVTAVLAVLVLVAIVTDFVRARRKIRVRRTMPRVLARGVPATLTVDTDADHPQRVEVRQAQPPDVRIEPSVGRGRLTAEVVASRRGAMTFPPITARRTGPLGLGRRTFDGEGSATALVYPDVFAAQRLVIALRRGRFRDPGLRTRGPLGLGTDFESIRDYLPDDDVRQINWTATARVGRPMSNVYRIEQDRDVVCLVDSGRLMSAPLDVHTTRLDSCVDAVTMVALVADELGDRCGVTIFDNEIRRRLTPRRNGGQAVVRTILDVEPTEVDSDHDLAFHSVGGVKRALIIVFTDLVDEAAAQSLLDAVPLLSRRHAVVVASVRDPDLDRAVTREPGSPHDVYEAAVAIDVLDVRRKVAARLRHAGADVVEAAPNALGEACVRAYLRLKARARL
jgi:uncharacterized protein (DUF58 family)